MKKLSIIIIAAGIAVGLAASCGDNIKLNNDGKPADTMPDASLCPGCPAAPTLGVQIDRMGRPAVNTVLNHGFDPTAAAGSAKDAYNANSSPAGWTQYVATFMPNLAILDALDTGLACTNGTCAASAGHNGCGDQVEFNGMVNGGSNADAMANSYQTLAGLLADDELYLDTSKTICDLPNHQNYLGVEFNVLTTLTNTCGGRAPLNDVIDTTYTAIAIGVNGFNVTGSPPFTPFFGDLVGPHADVDDDVFPFLGPPTN